MKFQKEQLYHIYNRGNNRQKIYFSLRNYEYFLDKIKNHILPNCDLIAYCLMPNHFHFLIKANEETIKHRDHYKIPKSKLGEGIRIMLSSYTRAMNRQEKRTGSLFTQNTHAKCLQSWLNNKNYAEYCFYYIHQNPLAAKLVKDIRDWPYSSYNEYLSPKIRSLCRQDIAKKYLDIDWENFESFSTGHVNTNLYKQKIF